MSKPEARLPRFTRRTEAIATMQLTARDLEILRQVAVHRFLRSTHITDLLGGSPQQTRRRLQLLYHHGYLERPRCQIDYYHQGGSQSMVYSLASRGAGTLRRMLDMPFEKMGWHKEQKKVGRIFLEHALLISDVMVTLEISCRDQPNLRLLTLDDFPKVNKQNRGDHTLRWQVRLPTNERIGVIPDAAFGIEQIDEQGQKSTTYYFLEADRGTMPIVRDGLAQTSFRRKLLAYAATWKQGIHKRELGLSRFRVLTVTKSAERCRHLEDVAREIDGGKSLFLFTTQQQFQPDACLPLLQTFPQPSSVKNGPKYDRIAA